MSLIQHKLDGIPVGVRQSLAPILAEHGNRGEAVRTSSLDEIRRMMDGGEEAMDNSFFPMPDGHDFASWNELRKRLMVLVNLVKASVRKVRSRVYGGDQRRIIHANPYEDDILRFIGGWYKPDMRDWFTNRFAYSNAPCMVIGKMQNGRYHLSRWIPDPCYTYLSHDPDSQRDYDAMAEFSQDGKRMQFMTKTANGVIYASGDAPVLVRRPEDVPVNRSYVLVTDYGFFPGVIAHADSRRSRHQTYSEPGMRDAVRFTVRATDIMFNGSLLQKVQTKGIMAISGNIEGATQNISEMMRQGLLHLATDGRIQFVTPDSNIGDTLALLDRLIEVFSVVHAIPVDDLNPTSSKGTSAEEAQRRAEPHLSMTRELADVAMLDEKELILRATGMRHWLERGGPVDIEQLREEVDTEINLQPPLKPLGSPGDAQIAVMGADQGAILPEDLAQIWNPEAPETKLVKVTENIKKLKQQKEPLNAGREH